MSFLSNAQRDRPLSELSTFGIGGPARYFLEAKNVDELCGFIRCCSQEDIPYIVIGKGSNSLFDDRGFDGLAILMKINYCAFGDGWVEVGAGYSFSLLGAQTARKGWSGLEFASGIPGAVGGAVYMNAGANGTETADSLLEVIYINGSGIKEVLLRDSLKFSYRHSPFQGKKGAIAAAKFKLTPSSAARQKQLQIVDYRLQTQPYKEKSAGCIFRNPEQGSAGALIERCGLKSMRIGDAEVSPMHANFIVNRGKATAVQVMELASIVKKTVKEQTGIELEMEIRPVPYTY